MRTRQHYKHVDTAPIIIAVAMLLLTINVPWQVLADSSPYSAESIALYHATLGAYPKLSGTRDSEQFYQRGKLSDNQGTMYTSKVYDVPEFQFQQSGSHGGQGIFVREPHKTRLVVIGTLLLTLGTLLLPRISKRSGNVFRFTGIFGEQLKLLTDLVLEKVRQYVHSQDRENSIWVNSHPLSPPGDPDQQCQEKSAATLPPYKNLIQQFFEHAGFSITVNSNSLLYISSSHPDYTRYGQIPLLIFFAVEPTLPQIFRHAEENNTPPMVEEPVFHERIAFLLTTHSLTSKAYRQMYRCKIQRQAIFIPLCLNLVRRAVRHSLCAQELKKKICLATTFTNLYECSTPVADPSDFFGRQKVLDRLSDTVDCLQHIGLFGLRKIGKTSLIWQLQERLWQHITAYIDLQHLPGDCAYLYSKIMEECLKEVAFKYPDVHIPHFSHSPETYREERNVAFIRDIVNVWNCVRAKHRSIKFVLLLDEAESLLVEDSGAEDSAQRICDFLGSIRDLSNQYGFLVSILVSTNPELVRRDTWQTRNNPGFHYYKEVFLTTISEDECNRMIADIGAQMGIIYTEESLSRIYYETRGHPYVTRQLCALIVQPYLNLRNVAAMSDGMIPDEINIQVQDVENAVAEYIESKSDYLESVWQRLSDIEQEMALAVATHGSCVLTDLISAEQSYQIKRKRRKAISILLENRIIEKCEHKYSLTMGLFERLILISN